LIGDELHHGATAALPGGEFLMGTEAADGYSRSANEPDSSTGNLGFRVAR
jgi:formylglycine-generating enzyme required for sulfatase activity